MDQGTAEVIKNIAENRRELGDRIAELERRVESRTNLPVLFAKNTWGLLGMAAGGGFLLATLLSRKS